MDKIPLTVVILTWQEEPNIHYSVSNVVSWAQDVFVLDSLSTDNTCTIATSLGAKVFYRKFDNYAAQRNYAIRELPISTDWILFLDADESLMDDLKNEIAEMFRDGNIAQYDGYYLRRRFYFMGKWIKYGGYYPTLLLRLFKKNLASCQREINEHIHVEGKVGFLKKDFIDNNKKDFTNWLDKHNKYATFEATQLAVIQTNTGNLWGVQSERKQWIRVHIWNKLLPPLVRPFIYFIYRYFFRFGFLDGKIGFIYHFMQGLVFHLLVDIKYLEKRYRQN